MRIAFVTNLCAHYRVRTFELLARSFDVDFLFFSRGDEWYWSKGLGVCTGDFRHEYLPGFSLGRTRITPALVSRLLAEPYDLFIKCINGRFALPATYWVARHRRRPFILWTGLWSDPGGLAHRVARPLTHGLYRRADAIVTYGEHVRAFLEGLGVNPRKIFVAPHAVDNDLYRRPVSDESKCALRRRLLLPEHARVILYIGRLESSKGLEYLLEAFSMLSAPDVFLVVVGIGGQLERLRNTAARTCGDRVRFAGQVEPDRTVAFLALAEVLVLPSVTTSAGKEPWGLVINEAFNQGVPVVATDAVGAAAGGLVRDDSNGFIVPERDGAAIAERLGRILGNQEVRKRLGRGALEVISNWDNQRMIDGFRCAIESVAGRTRPETTIAERRQQSSRTRADLIPSTGREATGAPGMKNHPDVAGHKGPLRQQELPPT